MLWPKRLLIFEDRIETRGTELLRETVETIRYRDVEEVMVGGRALSTSLLIKRKGKPFLLRGVEQDAAGYAKSLIEERMSRLPDNLFETSSGTLPEADLIRNLVELRDAGVLNPEEFEAKKKAVEERYH